MKKMYEEYNKNNITWTEYVKVLSQYNTLTMFFYFLNTFYCREKKSFNIDDGLW